MTHDADLAWHRRLRSWVRRNWLLDTAWRIGVFVVGVSLLSLGIVLLVLPGPGWAMIAIGLIVLASEYVWAQRLLAPVRARLRRAKAAAVNPQYRTQVRIASAAFMLLGVALLSAYVFRYGWSLDGVRGMWPLSAIVVMFHGRLAQW